MGQPDATFRIDPATPVDVPLILALIRELADVLGLLAGLPQRDGHRRRRARSRPPTRELPSGYHI